ncbi:MAG TPA: signal peptidase I [Clostridiales bacterium]|nr:signal peptidase I [Clostridiales bacterium]
MKINFEEKNNKKIKKVIVKIIFWVVEIIAVILLAFLIVNYTVEKTEMSGNSMEETLYNNDSIIIDKFVYLFKSPKRFDVIVFKQNNKEHSYYNIKRVIALPGETILIKDNIIYINGNVVEEAVNVEPMINFGLAAEEIILEENEYFVLGDNRNNSEDSRFASMGNIVKSNIIGKARLRTKPFNFIDKLNNINKTENK